MALKREVSLGVGLATAALVWGIYNSATPAMVDIRMGEPGDTHLASTERTATWTATAVVAGISLLAKDPTVFVLGGSMVVVLAWWHRHANNINPVAGSSVLPSSRDTMNAELAGVSAGYSPA
jgi:hypothetical protein